MPIEHRNLTGAQLHEPKGVENASEGTVYVADGAGSGTWVDPLSGLGDANKLYLSLNIPDISTAQSVFTVSPVTGTISKVWVVLHGAITVADAIVTAEINGVAVLGLSITCAFTGSAAGSQFNDTPTSQNAVVPNDVIEIITDGGSTTAVAATVLIELDVTP